MLDEACKFVLCYCHCRQRDGKEKTELRYNRYSSGNNINDDGDDDDGGDGDDGDSYDERSDHDSDRVAVVDDYAAKRNSDNSK